MFIFDIKSHDALNHYWCNSSLAIPTCSSPAPLTNTQHNANSCLTTSAIQQQTCSLGLRWVFSRIYYATAYGKTLRPCLPVKPIPTTGNLRARPYKLRPKRKQHSDANVSLRLYCTVLQSTIIVSVSIT